MDKQQIMEEKGLAGGNGWDDNRPRVFRAGNGGDESKPRVIPAGNGGDESRRGVFRAGSGREDQEEAHADDAAPGEVHAGGELARTGARMELQSGAVLNNVAQQGLNEWISYSQQTMARNSRALGELMGCRTPKDVMNAQYNLFKANVGAWLRVTGAMFHISTEKAKEVAGRMPQTASRSTKSRQG